MLRNEMSVKEGARASVLILIFANILIFDVKKKDYFIFLSHYYEDILVFKYN
jgi:hypothetical protein